MPNKMLIDAAHPEETRVVVVKGNRVEEFDYESANKKQLRGNIYLAKVTRVEPSLQAAFVDYGGNRHGFLAFTEIHPDYYQIPVADRQALLEAEAEEESRASAAEAAEDEAAAGRKRRRGGRRGRGRPEQEKGRGRDSQAAAAAEEIVVTTEAEGETPSPEESTTIAAEATELTHEVSERAERNAEMDAEAGERQQGSVTSIEEEDDDEDETDPQETIGQRVETVETNGETVAESVELVGSEDALEEVPERVRRRRGRPYKIQEVIRRRQIILVQVVKEERGTKGAALTTYLSLAGRYTVLMPNTARGGGISRKITNPTDRKRLREIAGELEVPEGMGLIIRTAGAQRTKTEIKRDYDYLLRLWETVRDLTLKSTAPSLVYEEGSLIKRSIRDLYNKDIDEVLVAGDEAYREAKDFMRMLMPSHAKNVKPYKEPEPVFIRFQVERQLGAMFSPQVVLKSGGYIVINQTEALVAIDVNSGKATREHNIEDTALKTNLEAAEEVARQLRLRDLAGLIVIDFIDMDERRNSRLVERRLKESLRNDRARIQVGRISHFGLLEMSRQRLRTGMLEGSTSSCAMCQGTGIVRSVEFDRARRAALARGPSHHRRRDPARGHDLGRSCALHPQSEALAPEGHRAALPDPDHGDGRRESARVAVHHRALDGDRVGRGRERRGADGLGASSAWHGKRCGRSHCHGRDRLRSGTPPLTPPPPQAAGTGARGRGFRGLCRGGGDGRRRRSGRRGRAARGQRLDEGGAQGRGKPRRRGRRGGRRGRGGLRSDQAAAEAAEEGAPAGEVQVSRDEAEAQPQQNGDGRKEAMKPSRRPTAPRRSRLAAARSPSSPRCQSRLPLPTSQWRARSRKTRHRRAAAGGAARASANS